MAIQTVVFVSTISYFFILILYQRPRKFNTDLEYIQFHQKITIHVWYIYKKPKTDSWFSRHLNNLRALTRPYRGRLTAPSQLKLAEYFPNLVFPKFLNPIKLKNEYYCFLVHTRGYKLVWLWSFIDYNATLKLLKQSYFYNSSLSFLSPFLVTCICCCSHR